MARKKKHSPRFETVKHWYQRGLWTTQMVESAIGKWITEAEASEILEEE